MAASVRSFFSSDTANATSAIATEPTGTANGDIMVGFCLVDNIADVGGPAAPSGWTTLYSGNPVNSMTWNVAYVARGGSAPALNWTWGGGADNRYKELYVVTIRSNSGGTLSLDSQSTTGTNGNASVTINPPSTVAVASASVALCGGSWWAGAGSGGYTVPSGYTAQCTLATGRAGFLASKVLSASGSEDPGNLGNQAAGPEQYWHGFTITITESGGASTVVPLNVITPKQGTAFSSASRRS